MAIGCTNEQSEADIAGYGFNDGYTLGDPFTQ
jgi:hypothetical protein